MNPTQIANSTRTQLSDQPHSLYSEPTPEGGVIRLAKWPEGYVLWHHGSIVWRSFRAI